MRKDKRVVLISLFIIFLVSSFFLCFFYKHQTSGFISFSDGAKFADIAKNLKDQGAYKSSFTFFGGHVFNTPENGLFPSGGIPPLMPYSIFISFLVFGVSDLAVQITSASYYLLMIAATYFLGRKLFGNLVGIFSAMAVAANIDFLHYSLNGASETAFTFLALLGAFCIFWKNKFSNLAFFITLCLLYLTRPQGIVFIFALMFWWGIYKHGIKKGLKTFLTLTLGIVLFDFFLVGPLSKIFPVYPIFARGLEAARFYSAGESVSESLRGGVNNSIGWAEVAKKIFYNIYNFYKSLPNILNPYLAGSYFIGFFIIRKGKETLILKLLSVTLIAGSFLLAAATIPFYRYLHPVIPFVYILAVAGISDVINKHVSSNGFRIVFLSLIIFTFSVGQSLGIIFLDSRFERKALNIGKPPIYTQMSWDLRKNTTKDQLILTNLDTWGSWYGERRTVWFPLTPKQIIDSKTGSTPFDVIYLTNYKIDDENYYMSESWRLIFENPDNPEKWTCDGCDLIAKEYKLLKVFEVSQTENYENIEGRSILLIKK